MATAAAIAAAAISAAGAVGGSAIAAHGAQSAAAAARPSQHKFPLPPSQQALMTYYNRLIGQNMTNVPPSFAQYVQSGGTATFPLTNPGLSPLESSKLGITGPRGQAVPFARPGQTQLTPEQQLYMGYLQNLSGHGGALAQAYRVNRRIGKAEQRGAPASRIDQLRAKRGRLLNEPPASGGLL